MDIFGQFKQHYAHYFLGVIIPALINGLSVPLLKQVLGPAIYGQYALYFNGMLLANLLLSGWLWQAILRFAARFSSQEAFAVIVFRLSLVLPIIFFVPVAALVAWQSGTVLLGLLFAATLLAAALQLPKQALIQASFQPRLMVQSEAVRMLSWLGGILLLIVFKVVTLPALFAALLLSYSSSTAYLYFRKPLPPKKLYPISGKHLLQQAKPLLYYGAPFSLWYVVFYGITYIDKVVMLHRFGPVLQGDYNALFDFASKGLVLLLAPVITSATPLLAQAYEKGETKAAGKLLRKLIAYEVLAMGLSVAIFSLYGYRPLFWLLKIPVEPLYIQLGIFIITGTFLWQIALLVQKRFELRLQSGWLLLAILVAFAGQAIFYNIAPQSGVSSIPMGYLLSAVVYLLILLVSRRSALGKA